MKRSFVDGNNDDSIPSKILQPSCTKDFLNRLVILGKKSSASSSENINRHVSVDSINQADKKSTIISNSTVKTTSHQNSSNTNVVFDLTDSPIPADIATAKTAYEGNENIIFNYFEELKAPIHGLCRSDAKNQQPPEDRSSSAPPSSSQSTSSSSDFYDNDDNIEVFNSSSFLPVTLSSSSSSSLCRADNKMRNQLSQSTLSTQTTTATIGFIDLEIDPKSSTSSTASSFSSSSSEKQKTSCRSTDSRSTVVTTMNADNVKNHNNLSLLTSVQQSTACEGEREAGNFFEITNCADSDTIPLRPSANINHVSSSSSSSKRLKLVMNQYCPSQPCITSVTLSSPILSLSRDNDHNSDKNNTNSSSSSSSSSSSNNNNKNGGSGISFHPFMDENNSNFSTSASVMDDDVTNHAIEESATVTLSAADTDSWHVVLLVDSRERDHAFIQTKILEFGLACEVKTLAVGDFLWVARPPLPPNQPTTLAAVQASMSRAVVLDCIAERKTIPDLVSSIIDRRYAEQKMRLHECGLSTCLYIVEGASLVIPKQTVQMSASTVRSAITSTQIEDGLHVLRTRGIDHTVSTLRAHYQRIIKRFRQRQCSLISSSLKSITNNNSSTTSSIISNSSRMITNKYMTYESFQKNCGKKQIENLGELFARVIRQAHGCSSSGAVAMQQRFGTLAGFLKWIQEKKHDPAAAQKEISLLQKPGFSQKIGPKVANTIWTIFATDF